MVTNRIFQTATECVQKAASAPTDAACVSAFLDDLMQQGWSSEDAGEVGAKALSVMAAIRVDSDASQPSGPRRPR